MAPVRALLLAVLALAIAVPASCVPAAQVDPQLLRALRLAKSAGGVVELTEANVAALLEAPSRPYDVILLADASHMRNNGRMKLGEVVSSFGRAAKAHLAESQRRLRAGELPAASSSSSSPSPFSGVPIFARMEFSRDRRLFGRLGVKGLPWLARIPAELPVPSDGAPVALSKELLRGTESYPWSAQDLADWVSVEVGVGAEKKEGQRAEEGAAGESALEPATSPSPSSVGRSRGRAGAVVVSAPAATALGPLVLVLALISGLLSLALKFPLDVYPSLYLAASLFLVWFSVSGGMYVVIRKMPFIYTDPRSHKTMAFLPGQGQIGAEGYLMGTAYLGVAAGIGALVKIVPRIKDPKARRVGGYLAIAVAAIAMRVVLNTHFWKTHLTSHWY